MINNSTDNLAIVSHEIQQAISDLKLDLSDRNVLTEAATGIFACTPIIAALAGAKTVYAVGKETSYGSMDEIRTQLEQWIKKFGISSSSIKILEKEKFDQFDQVDIVTNVGHVRPITRDTMKKLGEQVVISYMCEAWEFRHGDLDLDYCAKNKIPVAGVNEDHPSVNCFREVGLIALKILMDAKLSIYDANIVILSRDKFGSEILKTLRNFTSNVSCVSDFDNANPDQFKDAEILIVADYLYPDEIVGNEGFIQPQILKSVAPNVRIIQYCGTNNVKDIEKEGLVIHPSKTLPPVRMQYTLAEVSHKTVIRLHAGGLKVGQELFQAKINNDFKIIDDALCELMT